MPAERALVTPKAVLRPQQEYSSCVCAANSSNGLARAFRFVAQGGSLRRVPTRALRDGHDPRQPVLNPRPHGSDRGHSGNADRPGVAIENISMPVCNTILLGGHMPTSRLTPDIIAAAIQGYEAQKARIDQQISDLRAMLPGGGTGAAGTPEPRKRRALSAAARKRIADAQRKRWAKAKRGPEPPAAKTSRKPKRRLSEAGRQRIIEATKRRWALQRAKSEGTGNTPQTTEKKSGRK